MTVLAGISGLGRIGRGCVRALLARETPENTTGTEVAAVDGIAPAAALAHLPAYDATYGRPRLSVAADEGTAPAAGHRLAALAGPDPARQDWAAYRAGLVIESTRRQRA